MDKVQKHNSFNTNTPSSESYKNDYLRRLLKCTSYVVSNGRMAANDEPGRIWKDEVMALFQGAILSFVWRGWGNLEQKHRVALLSIHPWRSQQSQEVFFFFDNTCGKNAVPIEWISDGQRETANSLHPVPRCRECAWMSGLFLFCSSHTLLISAGLWRHVL
jgi:hypothetical protein